MSHEDLIKAAGAAGGFIGAAWAAAKFWKRPARPPEKGGDEMSDLLQRVRALETRCDEADEREQRDRRELLQTIGLLFKKADRTLADVAEIKGMLNARKGPR